MSLRYGMPPSTSFSIVLDRPPITAVCPSLSVNSVTMRCMSIIGNSGAGISSLSEDSALTYSFKLLIVGTMDTFMSPFVITRGCTFSVTPQLKNASCANMRLSRPGISVIRESTSSVLFEPLRTRLALSVTFGRFVVMSTMASLPLVTITFGFEKVLKSWLP